jgi:GntR family transcriptional regulator
VSRSLAPSDARLPIYQRLKDEFAAKIAQGEWSRREAAPSENQLAEAYRVAVGTVRKAIEGLVAEGLLERRQGKGTFVRRPDFGNAMFRFFRHVGTDGEVLRPSARILERGLEAAAAPLAGALALAPGAQLLRLFRERRLDGRAILVEDIALDAARFAALVDLPTGQFGDLLYPLYDEACGAMVARASETISFGAANARIADALDVAPDAAVAVIERIAFGPDGTPLEWRRSYGPADRFSYTIDLR